MIVDVILAPDLAVARDVDPERDLLAHDLDRRPVEDRLQPLSVLAYGVGMARRRLGDFRAVSLLEPIPNRHVVGLGTGADRRRQHDW